MVSIRFIVAGLFFMLFSFITVFIEIIIKHNGILTAAKVVANLFENENEKA